MLPWKDTCICGLRVCALGKAPCVSGEHVHTDPHETPVVNMLFMRVFGEGEGRGVSVLNGEVGTFRCSVCVRVRAR